jgi:hypothetical protein
MVPADIGVVEHHIVVGETPDPGNRVVQSVLASSTVPSLRRRKNRGSPGRRRPGIS